MKKRTSSIIIYTIINTIAELFIIYLSVTIAIDIYKNISLLSVSGILLMLVIAVLLRLLGEFIKNRDII